MEGLAHPDATIMWEGRSFLVDQSLHDKKLVCESYMSDKAFPSRSVDLTFYVTCKYRESENENLFRNLF